MKITFCLLQPTKAPIGGYKIVYEYANRLSERGHDVVIVHDSQTFAQKYIGFLGDNCLNRFCKRFLIRIFRNKITWFNLNKKIKVINSVKGIIDSTIPDADIVVATAMETVEPVNKLSESKGHKVCLAQDIENWNFDDDYVNYTYGLPIKYIAISGWIKDRIEKYAVSDVELIPNGLDFSKMYLTNEIERRNPYVVSMLYHIMPHKGSKYGISALIKLKSKFPELKVLMFGTHKRPDDLPEWFEYTQNASSEQLLKIYNSSAIFLCPTIDEGFGLTGAESMACGCALVSTNYRGVYEYAINGRNAVLCEKENPDSLFIAMKMLMTDNKKRIDLAYNGNRDIQKLDWNRSVCKFEYVLKQLAER